MMKPIFLRLNKISDDYDGSRDKEIIYVNMNSVISMEPRGNGTHLTFPNYSGVKFIEYMRVEESVDIILDVLKKLSNSLE